jgi:hypothetical protein
MNQPEYDPGRSVALAFTHALITSAEADANGEPANVADGLYAVARALNRIADAIETASEHADGPRQGGPSDITSRRLPA